MGEHRLKMMITIDNHILFAQDFTTFRDINIMQFIRYSFKQLFNLMKNGKYRNKYLEEAINDGEFNGWEGL